MLIVQSFADAGIGGQTFKVIDSFFGEDRPEIQLQPEKVLVRRKDGTPRGNPLSCLAFILLIRNLAAYIRSESKAFAALYADDTAVARPNLNGLLPKISSRLRNRRLEINKKGPSLELPHLEGSKEARAVLHALRGTGAVPPSLITQS